MSCINNFGNVNETFIIEPLVLDDTFVTGFTLSSNNIVLTQNRIDQYSAFTITLSGLTGSSLNVYVTGGTYNNTTGTATFVNSTGGTFQVTGFTTGSTSTTSGDYLPLSGGTVSGNTIFQSGLTASTISAITISGGTFYGDGSQLTGIVASAQFTGGTVSGSTNFLSGLTANTIYATQYQNLPTDVFVTGGTYSADASTLIFTNNTGGTFNVSGITSSGSFTGGTVSGATVFTSGLTANTISATTYLNLPVTADTFVTGFTLSSNTITLTQNRLDQYSAFTISLSAYTGSSSTSGAYLPLSGGTVTGNTVFTSGLTANTISATTYYNLPKDVFVTGGTYSAAASTLIFTNNTGGTFNVSGITTSTQFTGGTVSGATVFTSGLTANTLNVTSNTLLSGLTATTISATTYNNLPNTLYTGNGSLSGNRVVNIDGYTLNFSGSGATNNLVLSGGSVGIGTATPSASALFEISSTTKGFLGPRMTEAQRLAISSPVTGLIVYQTNADEGYFLYKSFGWVQIM
jgi:hypothetical protein